MKDSLEQLYPFLHGGNKDPRREGSALLESVSLKADGTLASLHATPGGEHAPVIGEVVETKSRSRVVIATAFGSERVIDMLVGVQLARIC